MISAVVLAKNEEKNIKECLSGLRWCDEIVVIDDFSDDKTVEIAEKSGAKVVKRHLNNDFSGQRNFALWQVRGDWVFFVDADERVSEKLSGEIKKEVSSPSAADGYFLKRIDFFGGRWLKHGEIGNVRILRLGRKGWGKWERSVDEVWNVRGKLGTFQNPLWHFSHPSLEKFLKSINERSSLNAIELFRKGRKNSFFDWLKPLAKFIVNYIFRLGFLDGVAGFVFAVLMSLHSFMVRGKLYLLWKKGGQ